MRRPGILTLLPAFSVALVLLLIFAAPGHAMNCPRWTRLSDDQKYQAITRMIDAAVTGSVGRQYRVNRAGIGRCLDSRKRSISYDFDDTCADSNRAGMQAINNIFKRYIWSCAG